ncbi:MAG: hypothetical protein LWY06_15675, partial [Firmicutes bacterium]|nr:hypothetical protein [Bacillota bacterium]
KLNKKNLLKKELRIIESEIRILKSHYNWFCFFDAATISIQKCSSINIQQYEILELQNYKYFVTDKTTLEEMVLWQECTFFKDLLKKVIEYKKTDTFVSLYNKNHADKSITQDLLNDVYLSFNNNSCFSDSVLSFMKKHNNICEFARKFLNIRIVRSWDKIWKKAVAKHLMPYMYLNDIRDWNFLGG